MKINITPNMTTQDLQGAVGKLLGNEVCRKCGGPNLLDNSVICIECLLKTAKCIDCGKQPHSDPGGIYKHCKECIDKKTN